MDTTVDATSRYASAAAANRRSDSEASRERQSRSGDEHDRHEVENAVPPPEKAGAQLPLAMPHEGIDDVLTKRERDQRRQNRRDRSGDGGAGQAAGNEEAVRAVVEQHPGGRRGPSPSRDGAVEKVGHDRETDQERHDAGREQMGRAKATAIGSASASRTAVSAFAITDRTALVGRGAGTRHRSAH